MLGAKYATRVAAGATDPATSRSSWTSPSGPSGSPLGVFVAPSTETAVMAGGAIPWVRKYASNSVAVYPPPSSRNAIVTPVPSLPGGKAYALATWDGV